MAYCWFAVGSSLAHGWYLGGAVSIYSLLHIWPMVDSQLVSLLVDSRCYDLPFVPVCIMHSLPLTPPCFAEVDVMAQASPRTNYATALAWMPHSWAQAQRGPGVHGGDRLVPRWFTAGPGWFLVGPVWFAVGPGCFTARPGWLASGTSWFTAGPAWFQAGPLVRG